MEKILVSACLLGECCRYDAKSQLNEKVRALSEHYELIPVCPERSGGLSTPRLPAERAGERVIFKDGSDATEPFKAGALEALRLARENGVTFCVLKANSPSCGKGVIYDGTFTGNKIAGMGVTAELLIAEGFKVITEDEL